MTKEDFLKGVHGWDNHRHLLWPALELTTGDVIELGMGGGSTPFLHRYCEASNRRLFSFDNDLSWVNKFDEFKSLQHEIIWTNDWDSVQTDHPTCDVLLVDHTPSERRYIDIEKYKDSAKIIVIHDSEPETYGYFFDRIWPLFKYRIDFKTNGVWATAVSNSMDVSVCELPDQDSAIFLDGIVGRYANQ